MKHLDIGSGLKPENPYGADELYGIDIQDNIDNIPNYKSVNLFTNRYLLMESSLIVFLLLIF